MSDKLISVYISPEALAELRAWWKAEGQRMQTVSAKDWNADAVREAQFAEREAASRACNALVSNILTLALVSPDPPDDVLKERP